MKTENEIDREILILKGQSGSLNFSLSKRNEMKRRIKELKEMKKMWKNININKNNIKRETDRAVLIAMPNSSPFSGYVFWHPARLVREGRNSAAVSFSFTSNFTFTLRKYSKRLNLLDEQLLSAEDMEEAFATINKNISSPAPHRTRTHVPDEITPTNHEALEELKDD